MSNTRLNAMVDNLFVDEAAERRKAIREERERLQKLAKAADLSSSLKRFDDTGKRQGAHKSARRIRKLKQKRRDISNRSSDWDLR